MKINFSQIKPYFTSAQKFYNTEDTAFDLSEDFELFVNGLKINYYYQEDGQNLLLEPLGKAVGDGPIIVEDNTMIEVELYKKVKII